MRYNSLQLRSQKRINFALTKYLPRFIRTRMNRCMQCVVRHKAVTDPLRLYPGTLVQLSSPNTIHDTVSRWVKHTQQSNDALCDHINIKCIVIVFSCTRTVIWKCREQRQTSIGWVTAWSVVPQERTVKWCLNPSGCTWWSTMIKSSQTPTLVELKSLCKDTHLSLSLLLSTHVSTSWPKSKSNQSSRTFRH